MAIIKRQETVHWQLCAQIIVFSTEHLLTHTSANLRLEVENCSETQVAPLATLLVLRMLDTTTSTEGVHTSEYIFVQM